MKKTFVCLLVCALLLLSSTLALAGTLSFDFKKDGDKGWQALEGEWTVDGGVYKQASMAQAPMPITVLTGQKFGDFTLEYEVLGNGPGYVGVHIGKENEKDAPEESGLVVVTQQSKGGTFIVDWMDLGIKKEWGKFAVNQEGFNKIKVVVKGENIKIYANDSNEIAAEYDIRKLKAGYIGLVTAGSGAEFKNIKITSDSIKEEKPAEEKSADKADSGSPKTGDSGVMMYVVLAGASMLAGSGMMLKRKKGQR